MGNILIIRVITSPHYQCHLLHRAPYLQLKIETDPYYHKTHHPQAPRRSMSIPTYRRSSDVSDDSAAPPSLATSSRRSKRSLGPVKGEFFM